MKKIVFFLLCFAFLSAARADKLVENIDGLWKGEMTFRNGTITYELVMNLRTEGVRLIAEAETEYGKMEVIKAVFTLRDWHDPFGFSAEMYEIVPIPGDPLFYDFFRFELNGDVWAEDHIEGTAEQWFNNHPSILRASGTFTLRKVKNQRWY